MAGTVSRPRSSGRPAPRGLHPPVAVALLLTVLVLVTGAAVGAVLRRRS